FYFFRDATTVFLITGPLLPVFTVVSSVSGTSWYCFADAFFAVSTGASASSTTTCFLLDGQAINISSTTTAAVIPPATLRRGSSQAWKFWTWIHNGTSCAIETASDITSSSASWKRTGGRYFGGCAFTSCGCGGCGIAFIAC